jgi:hypothetical protein
MVATLLKDCNRYIFSLGSAKVFTGWLEYFLVAACSTLNVFTTRMISLKGPQKVKANGLGLKPEALARL